MKSLVLIVLFACSSMVVEAKAPIKHRVVVDLFTGGPVALKSALGSIDHLREALKGQPLEIEVVAYGPAINVVLSKDNLLADKLTRLHKEGVQFVTCANTMQSHHISKGQLFPFVHVVPAGVAEVVLKQEEGWSYLRR